MSDIGWELDQFQRHRPHLEAVAYRMLGSVSEADDAVQEAWLRLSRSRQETIHNARAWLTTIVGRVCIDMLRARKSRREEHVGAWVPEPIVEVDEQTDPEHQTLIAESVGLALLVVLETLSPTERVAFVLHDMFALPFAEIAEIIDRSPQATRQLASRARRRGRSEAPQGDADPAKQREAVEAFLAASRAGDFEALVAVLDPGAVFRATGVRDLQPELHGATEIARSFATFGPRFANQCHPGIVNGQAGLLIKTGEDLLGAVGFTVNGGLITTIGLTVDPDKLSRHQGPLAERIITEALSWPGVQRAQGHLGSVGLRVGDRELGHLHGDVAADVPLPSGDADWVRVTLDTEEDACRALALLRSNYERARA